MSAPAAAPTEHVYSTTEAYRAGVVVAMSQTSVPRIAGSREEPAVTALAYSCLGVAVTDAATAEAFYAKLGFSRAADAPLHGGAAAGAPVRVLRSATGLELHLLPATAPLLDAAGAPINVLMDVPAADKGPGHTHASWSVSSLPAVKELLAKAGIPLSGTRSSLAVFVRDVDRTTLEFERNDGKDEPPATVDAAMIGFGRRLDHVGVRVRPPYGRHAVWYANVLGFNGQVMVYPTADDATTNMRPWVTRSAGDGHTHVEVNLILNCPTLPPPGGEGTEAALVTPEGALRPGILYAGFDVAVDADTALARVRAAGADAVLDTELPEAWKASLPAFANVQVPGRGKTVWLRDLCGSLLRLTPVTPGGLTPA